MEKECDFEERSNGSYVCRHCSRNFAKKNLWQVHFKRMHSGAHKCQECNVCFNTYLELRRHFSVAHPKLKRCSQCDYSHKLKYQVQRHERQSHGIHSVACSFDNCDQLLPFSQLKRHIKEKHSEQSNLQNKYSPSELNRTNLESINNRKLASATLKAHKLFDEEIGSHPKNFKQFKSVLIDSNFDCTICGAQRPSRVFLRRHIARVHEKRYAEKQREKKFVCPEPGCNKSFCFPVLLDDHLNRHRGFFPYECPRCCRKYSARSEYSRHLKHYHGTSVKMLNNSFTKFDVFQETEIRV